MTDRSAPGGFVRLEDLEPLATGRRTSLFSADMETHAALIDERLRGRRVAVIGAAGSIGSALTKLLAQWHPGALALFDLSENNLVELVRDLRSSPGLQLPAEFDAVPIALGSDALSHWLAARPRFDYLFNFAALKHVRSEKDIYSIARMVDTNVLQLHRLLDKLPYRFERLFSVSSDKAVNPANLMGATKMAMEQVLLAHAGRQPYATARFANVAFSDGSLPHGFLRRIQKRQPIAAPSDVRRYFISHREAAELCLLACLLGDNRDALFPKPGAGLGEARFTDIAVALLESLGYEPVECASDEEAKARAAELIAQGRWPCRFAPAATSGEKAFEEFHGAAEQLDLDRFTAVGVVRNSGVAVDRAALNEFLEFAERLSRDPALDKAEAVRALSGLVAGLGHIETGSHLDQQM